MQVENVSSRPTLGLALGGGAARGLAHIVVLEALDEMGVKPDYISGCSIGALLGAAYASGLAAKEIRAHALSVLGSPGSAIRQLFWPRGNDGAASAINFSLFRPVSLNGLGLVQQVMPPKTALQIEETDIPFSVVSTDFYAGREMTIKCGNLESAVAASIAIPGVISAPKHKGRVMIDGAYTNPVPMCQVRSQGCDFLVAVDVTGKPLDEGKEPRPATLVLGATQIMQNRISRLQSDIAKPDVMITPAIDRFAAHDFLRIKEILAAAEPERDRVKRRLEKLL